MRTYILFGLIIVAFSFNTQSWAQSQPNEPGLSAEENKKLFEELAKEHKNLYIETGPDGSGPGGIGSPPTDEDLQIQHHTIPTIPRPEDSEPGGINDPKILMKGSKDIGPEHYEPGGIGYPQEQKVESEKNIPGVLSIHRPNNMQAAEGVDQLLRELGDKTVRVKASLDEITGFVRRLEIGNKLNNNYTWKNGAPFERAQAFIQQYKSLFFAKGRTLEESTISLIQNKSTKRDTLGRSRLRYRQIFKGIDVQAQLFVRMDDGGITSAGGETVTIPDALLLEPSIDEKQASSIINAWATKKFKSSSLRISAPKLEIVNPSVLSRTREKNTYLAWYFSVLGRGQQFVSERVWLNAHKGEVIFHYSKIQKCF